MNTYKEVSDACLNSLKMIVPSWNNMIVLPLYPLRKLDYTGTILVKNIANNKTYFVSAFLLESYKY